MPKIYTRLAVKLKSLKNFRDELLDKHFVVYGTKLFNLILQLGGAYATMGKESHDCTPFHKLNMQSCCIWDTHMGTSVSS